MIRTYAAERGIGRGSRLLRRIKADSPAALRGVASWRPEWSDVIQDVMLYQR
ncbi:hypothetical protein [Streptomyces sp. NPDC014623]|uniref:hypothetical protein n=1 Tax=Streptomyces sp. NPDC014623 TaxID=3364875 RepID=UPI00370179B4